MGTPWYATREMLAVASDIKATTSAAPTLDRLLASATESVNSLLVRPFGLYPTVVTWSFDWPPSPRSRAYRLWLDERTLISLDSATSGGAALDVNDLILYPPSGPPYTAVETNRGTNTAFGGGPTPQGDLVLAGVGGYRNDEMSAGALGISISGSAGQFTVTAPAAAALGVGDLIRIGAERMIVTNRGWADTAQNVGGSGLTANNNSQQLTVTDGTQFAAGETLLLGAERVLVLDIAGDTLILRRAVAGSALSAHLAGEDIYAQRTLLVERGALGTTAAAHDAAAAIVRWVPPALATELCLAEALNLGQQVLSAYARTAGQGENAQEYLGRGLSALRTDARRQLGRRSRLTAV